MAGNRMGIHLINGQQLWMTHGKWFGHKSIHSHALTLMKKRLAFTIHGTARTAVEIHKFIEDKG